MPTSLFDPLALGPLTLPSRIVMAPMTRARSAQPGNVPTPLNALYYAQRASAALIVSEATQISPQGQGYSFTPGIYSDEQVAGWKLVTDAVHAADGRIFIQLWHVGRMSHQSFHAGGQPVAPSAISPEATVWIVDPQTGEGGMVPCSAPRALESFEVKAIIDDYRKAAENAKAAGFDGAEIHGANGYLVDQFLRRSANQRTDEYGGGQENRIRFAVEVAEAVASVFGADRVGMRLSPFITQRGMMDGVIVPTTLKLVRELGRIGLAYVHLGEADWDDAPVTPEAFRHDLRAAFPGKIIVAGKYDKARAEATLGRGLADLIAFARPFIANPDFPRRLREDLPLASFDSETLFGGDAHGYSTYAPWDEAA